MKDLKPHYKYNRRERALITKHNRKILYVAKMMSREIKQLKSLLTEKR